MQPSNSCNLFPFRCSGLPKATAMATATLKRNVRANQKSARVMNHFPFLHRATCGVSGRDLWLWARPPLSVARSPYSVILHARRVVILGLLGVPPSFLALH